MPVRSFHQPQSAAAVSHADASVMEGYDADLELARHLIFDATPTVWAADTLGLSTIEWDEDDDRLISDCGDYEITEDRVYGFSSLLFQGDLLIESLDVPDLKLQARVHRHIHATLKKA